MTDERGDDPLFVYLDDTGQEQGPFPLSTLASWVQGGYFDGTRQVRLADATAFVLVAQVPELAQFLAPAAATGEQAAAATGAGGAGPPEPLNEQEAMLSEYYKTYYEQAFAKAAAEYQEQLRAHEAAAKTAEAGAPPDDGYQVPKPVFEEYAVTGKFAKIHGRFMAEGQGGSEYWAAKGTQVGKLVSHFSSRLLTSSQRDREGRQLDHYYDVEAFNSAMAAGVVEKNAPDKKKAVKKKAKTIPQWMEEDPLEGAFK